MERRRSYLHRRRSLSIELHSSAGCRHLCSGRLYERDGCNIQYQYQWLSSRLLARSVLSRASGLYRSAVNRTSRNELFCRRAEFLTRALLSLTSDSHPS